MSGRYGVPYVLKWALFCRRGNAIEDVGEEGKKRGFRNTETKREF